MTVTVDENAANGDVKHGYQTFLTSVVSNESLRLTIYIFCGLGAAAAWGFMPGRWEAAAGENPARLDPLWFVLILIGGVASVSIPLVLQHHQAWVAAQSASAEAAAKEVEKSRHASEAEERVNEKAEVIGLLNGFISPCLEDLPKILEDTRVGVEAWPSIRKTVLNALASICGPADSKVRSVWFEADKLTLKVADGSGTVKTRRVFTKNRSSLAGSTTWANARKGEPVLWTDLAKEAPPGFERGANSHYKTFMTCGVLDADGGVLGMVNVDAPVAGSLTEVDTQILRTCARILGAALIIARKRAIVGLSQAGEVEVVRQEDPEI